MDSVPALKKPTRKDEEHDQFTKRTETIDCRQIYVTFSVGFTEVPSDHLGGFHLPELHILYSFQMFHGQYQLYKTHIDVLN